MDQLPRLGKRELICLLLFTCNYVVFVWRCLLFLWVLELGYVILLWHSLSLPYNYFLVWRFTVFCKIFNLKCDFVIARDARAVKCENSLSSHMNDF